MKSYPRHIKSFFIFALAVAASLPAARLLADDIHLKLASAGAMQLLRGYTPQRVELSTNQPAGIRKLPAGLTAPLYGQLKLGPIESPTTFFIVVDEPAGKPSKLFVDANANGDLTDDPPAEWTAVTNKAPNGKELISYMGGAMLNPAYGAETLPLHIQMYRFDKDDPQRTTMKLTLFYYGDYARLGEIKLGEKSYAAVLADPMTTGDFRPAPDAKQPPVLMLDLNGDGKFDIRREAFAPGALFNIGGTTYTISGMTASGASFAVMKSSNSVPETKPMLSLTASKAALPFQAKTTSGKTVKFPDAYRGKIVLLDFWATWCGPCVGELPNLTAVYKKYHSRGFEILGVSLDRENSAEKLAAFTKEKNMPWPQIYDGRFWSAGVAKQYEIESIPHAFLVDGTTGTILAEGESIRGGDLAPAIEKALAKKTGK